MMHTLLSKCFFLGCVMLSMVLGFFALLLPVRYDTVHPALLQAAGRGSATVVDQAQLFLDFGKPGPAQVLLDAADHWEIPGQAQHDKWQALQILHPSYRISGGQDPFFEQYLGLLNEVEEGAVADGMVAVNQLLSAKEHRMELLRFLATSSNQGVNAILETRMLTGLSRFMPVSSAAGAPFDTAILTTALLIQAGYCQTDLVMQLMPLAADAVAEEAVAVAQLEKVYMAVLGAAQRMNWLQLATWVNAFTRVEDLVQGTAWLRQSHEPMALVYAICVLADDAQAALTYRAMFGVPGGQDLQRALKLGQGALNYLLEQQLAVAESAAWLTQVESYGERLPGLSRLVLDYPLAARALMVVCLAAAGVLVSFGLRGLCKKKRQLESVSVTGGGALPGLMQHLGFGVLAVAALILLNEPKLLEQTLHEPGKLHLEFELSSQPNIIEEENMPSPTIDQVTLIVLLIFLFVQLVIYSLCLFKLAQIKRAQATAELKIKLLDNEEVLFDMGLYVGLSGTVISLLMLAMGIVQASLVAAYASTLFGIIFVALLKVLHIRPLKRNYILLAAQNEPHVAQSAL